MKIMMVLNREEIQRKIPYMLVLETMSTSVWGTMRRKRLFKEQFSEYERSRVTALRNVAHQWAMVKGVPDEYQMSTATFDLWQKLGAFCAELIGGK